MAEIPENPTIVFSIKDEMDRQMNKTLTDVYDALLEKGYNAIDQIVGYLLSEDPTYITNYNNARSEIRKIDRDELLKVMVQHYLKINPAIATGKNKNK
ncbi:MAG: IreB family regulatory phosphoprotein [Oscillospiraceae bacterium]|nr:IreB family regulatory phosphoprotein [Oscillospiraceae bacterium]